MNTLLVKHKPKDTSTEKWKEHWNNAHWTLEPLALVIEELIAEASKISRTDFNCPNHYAKLAFEAGEIAAYKRILEMLPKVN